MADVFGAQIAAMLLNPWDAKLACPEETAVTGAFAGRKANCISSLTATKSIPRQTDVFALNA
jgi:hypothetical protein